MSIVGLLVIVLVACLIWWVVISLLSAFGIGDPVATVVKVVLVVCFILWLISVLGYSVPGLRLQ